MSKPLGILVTTDAKVTGWADVQAAHDKREAELVEADEKAAAEGDAKKHARHVEHAEKARDAADEKEKAGHGWLVIDTDSGLTLGWVDGGLLTDLHALYDATPAVAVFHASHGEYKRLAEA